MPPKGKNAANLISVEKIKLKNECEALVGANSLASILSAMSCGWQAISDALRKFDIRLEEVTRDCEREM